MSKNKQIGLLIKSAEKVRKAGIVLMATSVIWGVGGFTIASEKEANAAKNTYSDLIKTDVVDEFKEYLTSKYTELHNGYFNNEINQEEYYLGLEKLEDPLLFFDYARESDDAQAQEIMADMDESTEQSVSIINGGLIGNFVQFILGAGLTVAGKMRKKELIDKTTKMSRHGKNNRFKDYVQTLNGNERDL